MQLLYQSATSLSAMESTTRPTSPIDVPGQDSASALDGSFMSSQGRDSISELLPPISSSQTIGGAPRPSIAHRSFTSPHRPGTRSRSGTVHRPGSSLRTEIAAPPRGNRTATSMTSSRSGQTPEAQWSVFGQLMEHELKESEARKLHRLSSRLVIPSTSNQSNTAPLIMGDSESPMQSPVEAEAGAAHEEPLEDAEEYDSDDSDTSIASKRSFRHPAPLRWYSPKRLPTLSNLNRSIAKCVIAYFIASLFTFTPYLASLISDITSENEPGKNAPSAAGHMVATV